MFSLREPSDVATDAWKIPLSSRKPDSSVNPGGIIEPRRFTDGKEEKEGGGMTEGKKEEITPKFQSRVSIYASH